MYSHVITDHTPECCVILFLYPLIIAVGLTLSHLTYCISGTTADWWSVGVILFELIVGIPPFNAEHPQVGFLSFT